MESYLEIKVEQSRTDLPKQSELENYLGAQLKTKSKLQEAALIQATIDLAGLLLEKGWAVAVDKHTRTKIATSVEGTPLPVCEYKAIKDNYHAAIDILKMDSHKILCKNTNIGLTYTLEKKAEPKELGSKELPIGKVTVYLKAQNL
jgi:flagellar motor switch protein FliM